jgi:glycosyltransferase involved in cell wall biosynthesis
MRIALDGIPLNQELTGVGHYTLELARALAIRSPADEVEIVSPLSFIPSLVEGSKNGQPPNLQFVQANVGVISRHWWTIGLPRYVQKRGFDLVHGTNFEVPIWKKCPTVLTIHDLSLLLWPQVHEKARVRRARRRLPLMARAATMIITPGESVRAEVCQHLKISPAKVVAIPEAQRSVFRPLAQEETLEVRKRLGIADDFLLYVGTIEPRKNLLRLVQAFKDIAPERAGKLQLVLAGKTGWLTQDVFDFVERSGMDRSIKFTGYLGDEELCALYSSCRAFVYPSLYEGFGLPPLEAMACGAPVIASRIPSIEAVTGQAAWLVDPENASELASSMRDLVGDRARQRELSLAGLARAAEFSWAETARLTQEVYAEAVKRFRKGR